MIAFLWGNELKEGIIIILVIPSVCLLFALSILLSILSACCQLLWSGSQLSMEAEHNPSNSQGLFVFPKLRRIWFFIFILFYLSCMFHAKQIPPWEVCRRRREMTITPLKPVLSLIGVMQCLLRLLRAKGFIEPVELVQAPLFCLLSLNPARPCFLLWIKRSPSVNTFICICSQNSFI